MNQHRWQASVVVAAVAVAVASTATAPTAATAATATGGAVEDELQTGLDEWRANRPFAATLSLRIPGRGDIHLSSGAESGGTDATYGIASVTKTFTTALALQLVDEGRLSLDEPVERWLPDLPNADRITLEMLLSHTAGFGFEPPQEPVGEPGEAFAYSNIGFAAIGELIESELDQDLAAAVDERLTGLLALDDTVLSSPDPCCGMVSSSADLLDWGEALYSGALLGDDMTAAMLEMRNPFLGTLYGLGVMGICADPEDCTPDKVEFVGHTGIGGSGITLLLHHPDSETTSAVHVNVDDFEVLVSMVPLVFEATAVATATNQG